MAISVGDLVRQPHLRIETLAGTGGLGRLVTWAHSSDLDEPWDWLSGGELLMKNGRSLARTASGQIAFLDNLAFAEASALVIGADPSTPRVGRRVLDHADRIGLPLLRVPYSMSFIVLSRAVADATVEAESRRVARTGRIYATIHAAVAGDSPKRFLARLEVELGCRLAVVDKQTAAPVLAGTPGLDAKLQAELLGVLARRGGAVPGFLRLSQRPSRTAVVVEVPYEEPTLLVAERLDASTLEPTMLQHAATATAVEVAHASLRQEYRRQAGSELLAHLLDSAVEGEAAARGLAGHGIDPGSARLMVARHAEPEGRRRLHIGLDRRNVPHLLLSREPLFWALVGAPAPAGGLEPAGGPEPAGGAVELVVRRLGPRTVAGVSAVVGSVARVPEAAREAMWMLAATKPSRRLAYYGEPGPLPALRDPEEARALVQRVLGPLLAYDRVHDTRLVASLATFLACRRSWQRTAAALQVHRQTVIYRMERVAQLTGRTLSETADLAELWLAVSALEVVDGPAEADTRAAQRGGATEVY